MQGGEGRHLVDLGEHVVVNEGRIGEVPAALDDTMADGVHFEAMLVDKIDDHANGRAVIG